MSTIGNAKTNLLGRYRSITTQSGLCVTTCPTGSLSLLRKPKAEQPYVPKDVVDANIRLGQARGKLNAGKLVGMLVKSKVDRPLASK